jgi:hypothetical protein
MSDRAIFVRNVALSVASLVFAIVCLAQGKTELAGGAFTFVTGLWLHSGRPRPGESALAAALPEVPPFPTLPTEKK